LTAVGELLPVAVFAVEAVGVGPGFVCKVLVDEGLVSIVPAGGGVAVGLACKGVVPEACRLSSTFTSGTTVGVVAGFACKVLVDEGLVSIVPAGVLVGVGAGLACAGVVAVACGLGSTFTSGPAEGVVGATVGLSPELGFASGIALTSGLGFASAAAGSGLTSGLGSGKDSNTITQSNPYPFVGGVKV
jgi:hypothetical protein